MSEETKKRSLVEDSCSARQPLWLLPAQVVLVARCLQVQPNRQWLLPAVLATVQR